MVGEAVTRVGICSVLESGNYGIQKVPGMTDLRISDATYRKGGLETQSMPTLVFASIDEKNSNHCALSAILIRSCLSS